MADLLNKYIRIEPGFQKSVNLAYDLFDEDKVADFIPSKSSVEILEKLILSTNSNSNDRAHILIGPYGKGKSHIILVLLSLLRDKNAELLSKLLDEIKSDKLELFNYIKSYIESDEKLLPVVIQGSSNSLNQSFLGAIQIALKDAGMGELLPDTHFHAALKHIQKWEDKYKETAEHFSKLIRPVSLEDFKIKLNHFDSGAYDKFVDLYPQLSAGGVFNPFGGVDVVELYTNVIKTIKPKGYTGIFVVYDEFSKYLESNIKDTSNSDIKMLQDFAEKANRSKQDQLHLLLIAHKDIENYIDQLPKEKVDGWRGVSERFNHIEMQSNYGQLYDVMSKAICKTNDFYSTFVTEHEKLFEHLDNFVKKQKIFNDLDETQKSKISKECYPLHPVSTFILPRLSELVAQNERTLFTFLSDNGKNTLSYLLRRPDFIESDENLITPDSIYDYFEPLIKKEVYTSDIYKVYSTVNSILVKIKDNSLQCKIVKDIATFYLVNQFNYIEPNPATIYNLFPSTQKNDVLKAISDLENKEFVLYARKSNGYLKLKAPSSEDVQKIIKNKILKIKNRENVEDILQEYASDIYLYPTAHNEENSLIRYFSFMFISVDELLDVTNWDLKVTMANADGVVYAIFPSSSEQLHKAKEHLLNLERSPALGVFIVPKRFSKLGDLIFKYKAIIELIEEFKDDDALISEFEIIRDDLGEVINNFINIYLRPELGKSDFIYNNKIENIWRKSHFSALLSKICDDKFNKTPIINNETINRNEISTTTANSSAKVIAGLLTEPLLPKLGLGSSAQEGAIARSILTETGIIENFYEKPVICDESKDKNVNGVIQVIKNFFNSCSVEKQSFSILYEKLTSPKFGIGLKKGVIPIFIAVVIHNLLNQIALYSNDKEIKIDEKALISINNDPVLYSARLQNWDENKVNYIKSLAKIFKDYLPNSNINNYSYHNVVQAMQSWFLSLPKYVKESKSIYLGKDKYEDIPFPKIKFLNSLKNFSINSYDFIFSKIPEIFNKELNNPELLKNIASTKKMFDSVLVNLTQVLILELKLIFKSNVPSAASLTSLVKDWTDNLKESTKEHVFDSFKTSIMNCLYNAGNDDSTLVLTLSKTTTGLRFEDWSNETIEDFLKQIESIKSDVDRFNITTPTAPDADKLSYILTWIDKNGNKVSKTFAHVECNEITQLLKNEIMSSIEDMGQSITEAEKRQILIEVLKTLC